MELKVMNKAGKEVGKVELNDELFNIEYNEALIHQIVVAQLANRRQGTKCTLTRAEVRGGEGKSPIGMPSPVSPWGQPALGYKTRKKKNVNDKFIIKRIN